MITFHCPKCQAKYKAENEQAQQELVCPSCDAHIRVPPYVSEEDVAYAEAFENTPIAEQVGGFVERGASTYKSSIESSASVAEKKGLGKKPILAKSKTKSVIPPQKSGGGTVAIIFIVLVLICGGGAAYYFKSMNEATPEVTKKVAVKPIEKPKEVVTPKPIKPVKKVEAPKVIVEEEDANLLSDKEIKLYAENLKKINTSIQQEIEKNPPLINIFKNKIFSTKTDVFPLLVSNNYQALCVAKKYKDGNIIFLADGNIPFCASEYKDLLFVKMLKLLTKDKKMPLIGVVKNSDLKRRLAFHFKEEFNFKDVITALSNIKEYDALIINAGEKISSKDYKFLKEFAQSGKGVFITPNVLSSTLQGELAAEGIVFTPTKEPLEIALSEPIVKDMNVLVALSDVRNKKGKISNDPKEQAIIAATLIRSMQDIPANDKTILPSFSKFVNQMKDEFDPKAKRHPFTFMEKIKIAYLDAQISAKPIEEQTKHPIADIYPGIVDERCDNEDADIKINVSVPYQSSTGFYARPGEVVEVTIPEREIKRGLEVAIGVNQRILPPEITWFRAPNIYRTQPLKTTTTKIVNPYGGPVYILVPDAAGRTYPPPSAMANPELCVTSAKSENEEVPVTLNNVVKMPHYVIGENIYQDWEGYMTDYTDFLITPMIEIECSNVILTLESKNALELVERPEKTAALWEEIMDECKIFTGRDFSAPFPLRVAVDAIDKAPEDPYPVTMPIESTRQLVDRMEAKRKGSNEIVTAMIYFFLGKAELLPGKTPVMRRLFTAFLIENTTTKNRRDIAPELAINRQDSLIEKVLNNPYRWNGADVYGKMTPYMQLVDEFGWSALTDVIAEYSKVEDKDWPETEEELHWDFARRYSLKTQKNLVVFFRVWGWAMPDVANIESWKITTKEPSAAQKKKGIKAKYTEKERMLQMQIWLPENFPDSYFNIE